MLDLHAAGPGSRILARLIDLFVQGVLMAGVGMLLGRTLGPDTRPGTVIALVTVALLVILVVLPIVSETLWRGRTPGKWAMGIRIVTMDGSPISFRHAMVRGVFQLIEVYVPIGLVPLVFARRSRRLGDLVAGTFGLAERSFGSVVTATVFTPPWGLEDLVAGLDVSRMTDGQYVFLRSVLLRLVDMSDAARAHVSGQVAARLEPLLGLQRPPWLAPEQFLVCVAGALQVRSGTLDRAWVLEQGRIARAAAQPAAWGQPTAWAQPVGSGW